MNLILIHRWNWTQPLPYLQIGYQLHLLQLQRETQPVLPIRFQRELQIKLQRELQFLLPAATCIWKILMNHPRRILLTPVVDIQLGQLVLSTQSTLLFRLVSLPVLYIGLIQPPSSFATSLKGPTSFHPRAQIRKGELSEKSLLSASWDNEHSAFLAGISGPSFALPWNEDDSSSIEAPQLARINSLLTPDLSSLDDPEEPIISVAEPHALSDKTRSNAEDNPTYDEAMRGPHADEYYEACRTELKTLVNDLDCWELVLRTPDMNVLPSTWSFNVSAIQMAVLRSSKLAFVPW